MDERSSTLVSCIITCYNQHAFLNQSISSVLGQTYGNIELIIVDDGSSDGTREFLDRFSGDRTVTIINNDHSGLPAVSRNSGLRVAKGEFVAFLDADDYWEPDKIQRQLDVFSCETMVAVGAAASVVSDQMLFGTILKPSRNDLYLEDLVVSGTVPLSSLMVSNVGFQFDEHEKFRFVEDLEFQLRICRLSKKMIHFVDAPLVHYRIHSGSGTASDLSYLERALEVINGLAEVLPKGVLRAGIGRIYLGAGLTALRLGKKEAVKSFALSVLYCDMRGRVRGLAGEILAILPKKARKMALAFYYRVKSYATSVSASKVDTL
jgi:glycosyltransferase involved in cell wall biosynthesis